MQDNTPKKRGRKPKNKLISEEEVLNAHENSLYKKKRGRKPTGKIIEMNKLWQNNGDFASCIIAHLPLTNKDIDKITNIHGDGDEEKNKTNILPVINIDINDDHDNQNIVTTGNQIPFSANATSEEPSTCVKHNKDATFSPPHATAADLQKEFKCKNCALLEHTCKELRLMLKENEGAQAAAPTLSFKHQYVCNTKLVDISNNSEWKPQTSICCWWCCNPFETVPLGLPEKFSKNTFYVQGCFCSFNCAHAYNLTLNDHKVWERYSLLNYLKMKIFHSDTKAPIIPAPPRQSLSMFGGPFTIEQYRETFQKINVDYHYMLPPMIPVIGILEEAPKELPQHCINVSNSVKLKRTKPLPSFNSNLLLLMKKT